DPILSNSVDQTLKVTRGWFCAGLGGDLADDFKSKAAGEIGPGRMMDDETPVRKLPHVCEQFGLQIVESPEVSRLVGTVFRCVRRIDLDQRIGDVPDHDLCILG